MEYKLSQRETKANIPEADRRGSQRLSRTLANYDLTDPLSDLSRQWVHRCQSTCALSLAIDFLKIGCMSIGRKMDYGDSERLLRGTRFASVGGWLEATLTSDFDHSGQQGQVTL